MTDAEILARARSDPDAQPLSAAELRQLRRPSPVDVKALRRELGLSQRQFASQFGFSVRTLQEWEQGRRKPLGPARILLSAIARDPDALRCGGKPTRR